MDTTEIMLAIVVAALGIAGTVAYSTQVKMPVEIFKGHSRDNRMAVIRDAPQQSGGLDRNGCHNASVPYRCH